MDEPDEQGNLLCQCKKCGKKYNADSSQGIGNLKRHVQKCKKRTFLDVGQMILDSSNTSGSLQIGYPLLIVLFFVSF